MTDLIKRVNGRFGDNSIKLFIGYRKNVYGETKPLIFDNSEMSDQLIFDSNCTQNLTVYLNKPEIRAYKSIGLTANMNALRSLLQLSAENRLNDLIISAFVLNNGEIAELSDIYEIENFVSANFKNDNGDFKRRITEINEMQREQRWNYWVEELKECIKCYACRAACPMCYCDKCAIECNNPQWVPVGAHGLGNLEWHIMRAMHLAGRCIGCNECAEACPLELPINLLTAKLSQDIEDVFGMAAGMKAKSDYVLSTYKFDDKESFIR